MPTKAIILSSALLIAAAGFAYLQSDSDSSPVGDERSPPAMSGSADQGQLPVDPLSPFAVSVVVDTGLPESSSETALPLSTTGGTATPVQADAPLPSWDASLSEADLAVVVSRLTSDPALLAQLIDEFRQESDPVRKAKLAALLGELGGDDVTLLASELIYSGNEAERTLGLNLLQAVQPGNDQARSIVFGMLATEVAPDVLVETMTALSQPGTVDEVNRAYMADQVAWLSTHDDVSVRGISLDILARWSTDGRHTDVFLNALDDESASVRSSAAYSLVGSESSSSTVVARLFVTLEDDSEFTSVRRAAALALNSMSLSALQQERLKVLEQALDRAAR